MAPYHHRCCQRHEVGCVCVSISSKHHQAELPNFSEYIRHFFSLRFYRHGIFGWFCGEKTGMATSNVCYAWCKPPQQSLNRLYFFCASRIQPLPSSSPLHISTSLPNRATFCRSACVFGVIAILLRPNTCTTTNHLVNRLRIACPIPDSERMLCKKKMKLAFSGAWRDWSFVMDWSLLASESLRTEAEKMNKTSLRLLKSLEKIGDWGSFHNFLGAP